MLYNGVFTGVKAYNWLIKHYGCNDERIGPDNVILFKFNKFERIFVFYNPDTKKNATLKENIDIGS